MMDPFADFRVQLVSLVAGLSKGQTEWLPMVVLSEIQSRRETSTAENQADPQVMLQISALGVYAKVAVCV
jgi:hypothetical protein